MSIYSLIAYKEDADKNNEEIDWVGFKIWYKENWNK